MLFDMLLNCICHNLKLHESGAYQFVLLLNSSFFVLCIDSHMKL